MNETIDNQQRNLYRIGYITGLIDGEGTITISRNGKSKTPPFFCKLKPHLSISNTNEDIIQKAVDILKENDIPHYVSKASRGNYRPSYRIIVEGLKRFEKLYEFLGEYDFAKRYLLDRVYDFSRSRLNKIDKHPQQAPYTPEEIMCYNEVRIYNERGGKSRYVFKEIDKSLSKAIEYEYKFEEMKKLIQAGIKQEDIAEHFNIDQSSVSKWIKRNSQRLP